MTNAPFNQLTPAEAERLYLLLEELGEAQQAIGKILRHGYESTNPLARGKNYGVTNRQMLEKELGDVEAAKTLMFAARDLHSLSVKLAGVEKLVKVKEYLHHQDAEALT